MGGNGSTHGLRRGPGRLRSPEGARRGNAAALPRITSRHPSLRVLAASASPVLALHGFLGRGADWTPIADGLGAAARVLAPDLPGHGLGPPTGEPLAEADPAGACSMDGCADALAEYLDRHRVERAVVAGYSMGGRIGLHFALTHPGRVAALVLVSVAPGLPTDAERRARRRVDARRADDLRADPAGFVARWYDMPLFDPLDAAARARLVADRLASGMPEGWARALTGFSPGRQPWHGARLHEIRVPAVALAGSVDAKFVGLARWMAEAGRVDAVVIPGAGHALLVERPDAVATALRRAMSDER